MANTMYEKNRFSNESLELNKKIYDEFHDEELVEHMNRVIMNPVIQNYFRSEILGNIEELKREKDSPPFIIASNHSGMAFPWDAIVFGFLWKNKVNFDETKSFRPLTSPMLSGMPYMHPYFMHHIWKKAGSIDASFINFETMMHYPKGHLLIYPEGVPGIAKGFDKKYKLQKFSTSFIKMAVKYQTEIHWYSTINGEYVAPLMYSSKRVNRLFNKMGIPFLPLGPLTILLLFPFAFYLAFPAQIKYVQGKVIRPKDITTKKYDEITASEWNQLRDQIQTLCQLDLDQSVLEHGKNPYHTATLLKAIFTKFPRHTPLAWPLLFHEFERNWKKGNKNFEIKTNGIHFLRLFIKNPICFFYYIPILGWLILVLYGRKKWRKNE
jgi:hypothetical protein